MDGAARAYELRALTRLKEKLLACMHVSDVWSPLGLKQIMLTTTNLGGPYIYSQCVIIKDATMIFTPEAWTTNADNKVKIMTREYKERWVVNSVILNIRIIYLFICF